MIGTEVVNHDDLMAMFAFTDEGICVCELLFVEGHPVDYRFLHTNSAFDLMSGLDDPVGKTAYELIPALEPHWVSFYAEIISSGQSKRFEQRSEAMDRFFDVLLLPLPTAHRFALVCRDRTEQRTSEAAQRRQTADAGRYAEEHDISIRLQRALLPDRLVTDPRIAVSAWYEAPGEVLAVGGDWYDSYRWPDGFIGVIVGDVAGHGIEAAAAMGRLRSAMAAIAPYIGPHPGALLDALDTIMRGPNGTPYATACCAVLDPETGTLQYSSAGHPPLLVVDEQGRVLRLNDVQSPPLCHLVVGPRPTATAALSAGSSVVFYSDGIVERRGESLDLGHERFSNLVAFMLQTETPQPAKAIVSAALVGQQLIDDVVVVVLRLLAVGPTESGPGDVEAVPQGATQVR